MSSEWDDLLEAEASDLYDTLVIWKNTWESVGLSRNDPETPAEAQALGQWLRGLGIPKLRGKVILKPPAGTTFGSQIAKSGIEFQI